VARGWTAIEPFEWAVCAPVVAVTASGTSEPNSFPTPWRSWPTDERALGPLWPFSRKLHHVGAPLEWPDLRAGR